MRVITAEEINRVLTYPALIEALREALPRRHRDRRCATPT